MNNKKIHKLYKHIENKLIIIKNVNANRQIKMTKKQQLLQLNQIKGQKMNYNFIKKKLNFRRHASLHGVFVYFLFFLLAGWIRKEHSKSIEKSNFLQVLNQMREIDDRSVIYEWKKSSLFECETGTVCSTAGLSGHWSLRLCLI